MEKNKICWIRVLKNLCYFLIPILIVQLILSIVSVTYVIDKGITTEENYYDTKEFAESYFQQLEYVIKHLEYIEDEQNNTLPFIYGYEESQDIILEEKNTNIFYQQYVNNFKYLIINHNNTIYTNSEYGISYGEDLEDLKEKILSNKLYWTFENGKVDTSIDKFKENRVKKYDTYTEALKNADYTIYTSLQDNLPYYDSFFKENLIYNIVKSQYDYAIYSVPIAIVLLIIMIIVIIVGIGKTGKQKEIYLNWFDKLYIEWAILLTGILTFFGCVFLFGIGTNITAIISVISIMLGLILIYIVGIILFETIVKRLKTHTFIKRTFAYYIYSKSKVILQNLKLSIKSVLLIVGFGIINCIGFEIFFIEKSFIGYIALTAIYIALLVFLLRKAICIDKIRKAIEQIYKGNTQVQLNENEFTGIAKETAVQINDIAGGLSNAINEKMKSERLKTELITNVSHDIKTPLTSIINYVDLLKKEGITSEKAEEYLAILDNKSQRLKKLTEDLVEASKASSGNIKLNMEKLEVNELIKQVSAEFDDKFKKHGLEEIITFTKNPIYINADSRYMYRVLANVYSNVSKYAMENSRVYTDIIEHGNNVIIQIKNISREKLNISADELMQRFVRGDTSRNTEGSGLGLSIANSLIELQGGKFHIYLDGDLFKITIGFQKRL